MLNRVKLWPQKWLTITLCCILKRCPFGSVFIYFHLQTFSQDYSNLIAIFAPFCCIFSQILFLLRIAFISQSAWMSWESSIVVSTIKSNFMKSQKVKTQNCTFSAQLIGYARWTPHLPIFSLGLKNEDERDTLIRQILFKITSKFKPEFEWSKLI